MSFPLTETRDPADNTLSTPSIRSAEDEKVAGTSAHDERLFLSGKKTGDGLHRDVSLLYAGENIPYSREGRLLSVFLIALDQTILSTALPRIASV
jgi:hypothetical protein